VEGNHDGDVRMMLTGQVFAIMDKTADKMQAKAIADSADAYLYDEQAGGYRLNTNFHEVKTDLGRMFGFAYGEKENGAVFSHMTVMYAYALYSRGLVKEGYKALHTLYEQASDEKRGKMYPGIPEYFEQGGKGVYQYLTGAASWYLYTVLSQMFGIGGHQGDLRIEPRLLAGQFNEDGDAAAAFTFAGKKLQVTYHNAVKAEYGNYRIGSVYRKGQHVGTMDENGKACYVNREEILSWGQDEQQLIVELVPCD
jgi:cellobiose phosphorylase